MTSAPRASTSIRTAASSLTTITSPTAGQATRRRHGVGGHGQRHGLALGVGQVGQPGLGQGKYLDGDYH